MNRFALRRAGWSLGLIVLSGLALSPSRAAETPVPSEHFFRTPAISEAVLSPSGREAALVIAGPTGQTALAIVDMTVTPKLRGLAGIGGSGVRGVRWVNDKRLVFTEIDRAMGIAEQDYRLMAINADGSGFKRLIGDSTSATGLQQMARSRALTSRNRLARTLQDGSGDVLVSRCEGVQVRDAAAIGSWSCKWLLDRLNTETGATRPLTEASPDNTIGWLADGQGVPRVLITQDRDRIGYHWRDDDHATRQLASLDSLDENGIGWSPREIGLDGKLYVTAAGGKNGDTAVLTTLDLATGRPVPEPLVSIAGFDFRGALIWDSAARKLVGVRFASDAPGIAWLDKSLQQMQADIDKLLPGTNNLIQCGGRCLSLRRVLVSAESDLQPPVYFVYDRDQGKLELIGAARPWIDPARMATREFVRIQTRDGMDMPVHVTRPRQAKGPLPAVVLVHGGPYVDGAVWQWDADSQFLASRGYVVIEPDYRGTTRYGFRHYRAGWKQWGLKMQDDITDATQWAVKEGLADPKRLVIAGASYGGYATMMGLVREPTLYRAGVNWVGVTDIVHWTKHPYSDLGDFGARFYLPRMVGDLKDDREQLALTSPVQQAARIQRPVLMAYGAQDLRVPISHGQEMRDALKALDKPVEWIEYAEEGHGFFKLVNAVDFWTRVERFLAEHTK